MGSAMVIGFGYVTIHIFESHSLKEKRRVVRSLIERVRGLAGHMGPPAERGANQVVG